MGNRIEIMRKDLIYGGKLHYRARYRWMFSDGSMRMLRMSTSRFYLGVF